MSGATSSSVASATSVSSGFAVVSVTIAVPLAEHANPGGRAAR